MDTNQKTHAFLKECSEDYKRAWVEASALNNPTISKAIGKMSKMLSLFLEFQDGGKDALLAFDSLYEEHFGKGHDPKSVALVERLRNLLETEDASS